MSKIEYNDTVCDTVIQTLNNAVMCVEDAVTELQAFLNGLPSDAQIDAQLNSVSKVPKKDCNGKIIDYVVSRDVRVRKRNQYVVPYNNAKDSIQSTKEELAAYGKNIEEMNEKVRKLQSLIAEFEIKSNTKTETEEEVTYEYGSGGGGGGGGGQGTTPDDGDGKADLNIDTDGDGTEWVKTCFFVQEINQQSDNGLGQIRKENPVLHAAGDGGTGNSHKGTDKHDNVSAGEQFFWCNEMVFLFYVPGAGCFAGWEPEKENQHENQRNDNKQTEYREGNR